MEPWNSSFRSGAKWRRKGSDFLSPIAFSVFEGENEVLLLVNKYVIAWRNRFCQISSGKSRVTNGKGQGNGLFGSLEIARKSKGSFLIVSGEAFLISNEKKGHLLVRPYKNFFHGTTIQSTINASQQGLLESALKFGGKLYEKTDYIETQYELYEDDEGCYLFDVSKEASSVGSRISGEAVRRKALNILSMSEINKMIIDFSNEPIVSSSFADEFIVKMILKLGKSNFDSKIYLKGMTDNVNNIILRSYNQRIGNI